MCKYDNVVKKEVSSNKKRNKNELERMLRILEVCNVYHRNFVLSLYFIPHIVVCSKAFNPFATNVALTHWM